MEETVTIRVYGKPVRVTLAAPASYAVRAEINACGFPKDEESPRIALLLRPLAAALGVCWVAPNPPKVTYEKCGYNPLTYGGRVLDELLSHGVRTADILAAGSVAWRLVAEGLVPAEEVASAEAAFPGKPSPDGDRGDGAGDGLGAGEV